MQVEILPAAPLPGGVKVARRFVKPHGVGASPTLAANFGRQADTSWLHLSREQDRHRRGRSITDAFRQFSSLNQRKSHETRSPLSKPVALPQELQTKSCPPRPSGGATESRVP